MRVKLFIRYKQYVGLPKRSLALLLSHVCAASAIAIIIVPTWIITPT